MLSVSLFNFLSKITPASKIWSQKKFNPFWSWKSTFLDDFFKKMNITALFYFPSDFLDMSSRKNPGLLMFYFCKSIGE